MKTSLRCLIVDRDPEARKQLSDHLGTHAKTYVLAEAKTVAEAILLLSLDPNVIFLDNTLAEGHKLSTSTLGISPYVVVVLAKDVRGVFAAYENYALDFLLKPHTPQRIARSVTKFFIHLAGTAALAEAALQRGAPWLEGFKVTGPSDTEVVKMGDVSLIKAAGNYTRLTQSNGVSRMLRRTMVAWAKELANQPFFRIDRSTLINLEHVVSYQRISRVKARLQLNGLKAPLVLGRGAISRFEKRYRAQPEKIDDHI
jgi:two-component system LytT family response regulator